MPNEEIKLKPCPFCGKRVAELTNARELEDCANFEQEECPCESFENAGECGLKTIVCNVQNGGCGASAGYWFTDEGAVAAWNRRAKDAE